MRKYKYRHLKNISRGITIAYLTSAILWGVAGCSCYVKREQLKDKYLEGCVSREHYIAKSKEFSEKEEHIFKCLGIGFGLTFATDAVCFVIGYGKEY